MWHYSLIKKELWDVVVLCFHHLHFCCKKKKIFKQHRIFKENKKVVLKFCSIILSTFITLILHTRMKTSHNFFLCSHIHAFMRAYRTIF